MSRSHRVPDHSRLVRTSEDPCYHLSVSWRRLWPHVRAALVLLHLVAVVALAIPSLRAGLDRGSWADPTVQDEFRAGLRDSKWSRRRSRSRRGRFAQRWSRLHEAMTAPFEPYRTYLGVRQPWVMFVAPHRYPARLEIEILEAGELAHDLSRAIRRARVEAARSSITIGCARLSSASVGIATRRLSRVHRVGREGGGARLSARDRECGCACIASARPRRKR